MGFVEEGYEGNPKCEHQFKWEDGIVIDTLPQIIHVACKKCGRVEHEEYGAYISRRRKERSK